MRQMMLEQTKSHELHILQDTDTLVEIGTPIGTLGVTTRNRGGIRLRTDVQAADSLVLLRASLLGHFEYYLPDLAKTMIWSDASQDGMSTAA